MMLFDIIQLCVILATIAVFGYYYYLAGKVKGVLLAIKIFLEKDETKS